MSDVFIWTVRGDVHARCVEWAVRQLGGSSSVWIASDFPSISTISCSVGSAAGQQAGVLTIEASNESEAIDLAESTFWRRRPGVFLPHSELHPDDIPVANKELMNFGSALQYGIDNVAGFSVNTFAGSERARSKILQLEVARSIGMSIPETLVSNSVSAVREFCSDVRGSAIIKSFSCPTWVGKSGSYFAYARHVSKELLSDSQAISAAPAIYQRTIQKRYEVRAFFAGSSYLAVRLDSQQFELSQTDWRAVSSSRIPLSRVELPSEVTARCIMLMKQLGIVTGSFDFAVTPDGEYVFFEVNEQGQFMWMEDRLGDVPCLQMFAEFLLSKNAEFVWREPETPSIRFSSYASSDSWAQSLENEMSTSRAVERRAPYLESETIL